MTSDAAVGGGTVESDLLGLVGKRLPEASLPAASGKVVSFSKSSDKWAVIFCYPGDGLGEKFPHLAGCAEEARGFRALLREIVAAGARVYGVSTQGSAHQLKFHKNLGLNYELLSDKNLRLANGLGLPTDQVAGGTVLLRLTILADPERVIRNVFFPIHDPAAHPAEVLAFFRGQPGAPLPSNKEADGFDRM